MRQLLVRAISALVAVTGLHAQAAPRRPNVVLIITDDVGYGDFGSYGAPDIKTPNIDGLASDGVRLTDFYANGANCSPTRAGLISGRYQQRFAHRMAAWRATTQRRQRARTARNRAIAAAAAEEQWLRDGADRQVASRIQAGVQPERARVRLLLRLQERLHRLLPAHRRRRRGGPVRERSARRRPGLHDGSDHRAVRCSSSSRTRTRRSSSMSRTTPRTGRIRCPTHPSVARDHGRHLSPFDDPTSTRADYVADARARRSRRRRDSARARQPRAGGKHDRDLHQRQRRRVAVAQRRRCSTTRARCGKAASACRRSFGGRDTFPPGKVSGQVGITMDLTASILAATKTPVPPERALDGIDLFPVLERRTPPVERTLFWRVSVARQQLAVRSGDWKLLLDNGRPFLFNVRTDLGERTNLIDRTRTSRADCGRCSTNGRRTSMPRPRRVIRSTEPTAWRDRRSAPSAPTSRRVRPTAAALEAPHQRFPFLRPSDSRRQPRPWRSDRNARRSPSSSSAGCRCARSPCRRSRARECSSAISGQMLLVQPAVLGDQRRIVPEVEREAAARVTTRASERVPVAAQREVQHHEVADHRHPERRLDAGGVGDPPHHRRHDRAADDAHHQQRRAELGVVAQTIEDEREDRRELDRVEEAEQRRPSTPPPRPSRSPRSPRRRRPAPQTPASIRGAGTSSSAPSRRPARRESRPGARRGYAAAVFSAFPGIACCAKRITKLATPTCAPT